MFKKVNKLKVLVLFQIISVAVLILWLSIGSYAFSYLVYLRISLALFIYWGLGTIYIGRKVFGVNND